MSERYYTLRGNKLMLLKGLLVGYVVVFTALAQGPQAERPGRTQPSASPPTLSSTAVVSASRSNRQAMMYRGIWGVDNLQVKQTASGELIRFSWRVVDASKAKVLSDKKEIAYLIEQSTGAKLEVPQTEKVGQLRQVAAPENGREYWMVFFNSRHVVKPGARVNVVVGKFRVDGLVVE